MDQATRDAYRNDGAVLLKGALNAQQLAECRAAFDFDLDNPGPGAHRLYYSEQKTDITKLQSHVDNANPLAKEHLDELVTRLPFGELFADLWGSKNVWYFAEEIFLKGGGKGARTVWHQDTSYLPWAGAHWANAWITFEPLQKKNCLEIVRGSHRGTRYDGTTFRDPNDPTDPLHGGDTWPRMPDIEAERKVNPDAYDILSWDTEPGDVVVLHPGSLHGGAPIDADCPERHTFVLRFFGDDATFSPLPEVSRSGLQRNGILFVDEMKALQPGEPFRSSIFKKVV